MKAVIMAGGEGTRLRPLSLQEPKPMVPLFDRPVLSHTLDLLQKHKITEACLTLRFLPQVVKEYFGDGKDHGMELLYQVEDSPLGTAGSVRACQSFIGEEDVLVLSGDAVCDFDLTQAIATHRRHGADATIVLYAHPEPLEYGLVMTDEIGRIEGFVEKPPWKQVFTNRINTGIYILSPRALAEIPPGEVFDFSKDLFPKMMEKGMKLYGVSATGYWCDIGSPGAYLDCMVDALEGKAQVDFRAPQAGKSIWSHSPIPQGVSLVGPCYIGRNVFIEPGATIGPWAILGEGSRVAQGAVVSRSMLDGACLGENVTVDGAILGKGAQVLAGGQVGQGAVVGAGTILGEGVFIAPGVRIWPQKEISAGQRVVENIIHKQERRSIRFRGGGMIVGEQGIELTAEALLALGGAIGEGRRVGISYLGGGATLLAMRTIACGICAHGGTAVELGSLFEAAARHATQLYGLERGIYVFSQGGKLCLRVFARGGLPLAREEERKIEAKLQTGELNQVPPQMVGEMQSVSGTAEAYIAAATKGQTLRRPDFCVEVRGVGGANRALALGLDRMGVPLSSTSPGRIVFESDRGGLVLRAQDEQGNILESQQLLAILVQLAFERGAKTLALPYAAPMVLDQIAKAFDGEILRLGKDPTARARYNKTPFLHDAVFAACYLTQAMARRGQRLYEIAKRTPKVYATAQEVLVQGDRAAMMQSLTQSLSKNAPELVEGLRVQTRNGWVHISPSASRPVLKVSGESGDMEMAEEICAIVAQKLKNLDENS